MSKIRNRSVKTLPYDLSNLLTVSHKNKYRTNYQEVDYFGENIQDVNTTPPHMPFPSKDIPPQSFSALSSGDVDSITLELNKLSGLSSSSSLSWSDEYESETTKKVQDELERMDRVLRGEEPIPPHYDKDEYEQWMNIFPNLSIFDRQITPTNSTQDIAEVLRDKGDELVVYGSDTNRFLHSDTLPCNKKNKQSVIDGAEHSYDRLLNQRSANTRKRKYEESKNRNRNIFITSHKPKSLDTDKYLKISSIKSQANERKLSSKSLLNREVSKEYSDTSPEYTSLPFLKIEELDFSKRNSTSSHLRNRKNSSEKPKKKIGTHLILPPIVSSNQFRSISATPRNTNKTFSAFSTKLEKFKEHKTRKLSVSFLETPGCNR